MSRSLERWKYVSTFVTSDLGTGPVDVEDRVAPGRRVGSKVAKKPYFPKPAPLSNEDYESLLYYQGGGCAICGRAPSPGRRFARDHDHHTGIFRGLLCYICNNRLLGRGLESAQLHAAAATYLTSPPAVEWGRGKATTFVEIAGVGQ